MTTLPPVGGAPIWFDLMSSDPARATEFYEQIFGWNLEGPANPPEFGGYQNFTRNGKRVAGMVPPMGEGPANIWSVYLNTADAHATVAAAEAAGATVMVPPMAVGDLGSMMVVTDPRRRRHRVLAARHAFGLHRMGGRARHPVLVRMPE